jgi:hypothetical protein
VQDLTVVLDTAVRDTLAHLRSVDPDAAADLAELRRAHLTRPGVVVVGETKRGKSSLINALLGVPGLSPVDAAVTTAAYIDFVPGDAVTMRAWLPGGEEIEIDDLDEWATGRQRARRIEVTHPAPLLRYLSLLDTPGAGGLDPAHATIALAAVRRATALLFVADASAPLSQRRNGWTRWCSPSPRSTPIRSGAPSPRTTGSCCRRTRRGSRTRPGSRSRPGWPSCRCRRCPT